MDASDRLRHPRHELFALHHARGAGLADAVRLAGYSPQGARQRGCILMTCGTIRRRVEEHRARFMSERAGHVARAMDRLDRIAGMALDSGRPATALQATRLQLKLAGVIRDRDIMLYRPSPDDDLAPVIFDPREGEDPPFPAGVNPTGRATRPDGPDHLYAEEIWAGFQPPPAPAGDAPDPVPEDQPGVPPPLLH
ncbi:hypothetical protein JL101_028850 (plasmid) [Skermanella rosea]|uniref:hypothetical protein n=1 Tax=Skermanella rosea TaxID=1817965 RepID=UPI0019316FAB|nr:hypothetical protein [Skermanella rosea]UEM07020.1 hypothetical protein JL101_028850 [Skermanella rosea]